MKKLLVPFAATLFLITPSVASAASLESESPIDMTTGVTPVDTPADTPIDEIVLRATKVSWSEVVGPSKSIWTDAIVINSSKSSLKLEQVIQGPTTSWTTSAKVEYRLYKKSGSDYVDTGIYDICDGTYTYPNAGPVKLEGSISSGTYKIKIINKKSVDTSISGYVSI